MYCTHTGLLDLAKGLGRCTTYTGLLDLDLANGLGNVLYLHRTVGPC